METDRGDRGGTSASEWREVALGDVLAEFHDGPHATPPPSDSGPVYLGIKNITEGGALDLSNVRHIAPEDFDKWTKRATPAPGDVVFTYEATLHRYALIPDGFEGCLGRRLALMRPRRDRVDPKYLHLTLLGPEWRQTVEDRVLSGATVDRVPIGQVPRFPIRLPRLATQHRIAAVLSAFDELIVMNERRIELLEDLARSLYREWFVHFRFPGHENVELVDSELGPIPEGWEVVRLGELATLEKGLSYKGAYLTGHGTPMANLKCLRPSGGFRRVGTKAYAGPFKGRHAIEAGDLIVANTDLTQAGNVIGSPAVVPTRGFEEGGLVSHHLFAVRLVDRTIVPFAFQVLADERFRAFARGRASGTTVLGLRADDAVDYPLPFPPASLLQRYTEIGARGHELGEQLLTMNEDLATTRDLLLSRLVTGNLDISDIDLGILEPAEVD